MSTATVARIPVANLEAFCLRVLSECGVSAADARTTVNVLVTTDTWGVFTHGTKALRGCIRRVRGGGIQAKGVPTIVKEGPAWAIMDGQSTLGMVTGVAAMNAAIAKARASGIGYVGVRNTCHFGGAGYYAAMAAKEGLIAIAMANDTPSVVAPGSRKAVTGSNPLAYAVPAGNEPPIMLDMAISTVAGGKVYAARALGKSIPDNWIVGEDGLPTTDPSQFPVVGGLFPMAGHKGYGIALLIESLAGLLSGARMTWEIHNWMLSDPSLPTGHGAAFLAIDVASMMPMDEFKSRVDALISEVHVAPKAAGAERIYLPGEMEWERRRVALVEGIPLPPDVLENLRGLADDLKLQNEFTQLLSDQSL